VVASGAVAAHAAAAAAERRGFPAAVLDTRLEGEASVVAGEVLERSSGSVSVYAGETTVSLRGDGIGGRNHEAALTAATLISGVPDVFFLAAGTDGIDGTTDAAGAFADGTTVPRAQARGRDAAAALERNDSGSFFADLGDQVITGHTGTNVGDLWLVLRSGRTIRKWT
jgi:glycerate-2-kinase